MVSRILQIHLLVISYSSVLLILYCHSKTSEFPIFTYEGASILSELTVRRENCKEYSPPPPPDAVVTLPSDPVYKVFQL
jgi:hypothetical protein